jgi:hypothetical protein
MGAELCRHHFCHPQKKAIEANRLNWRNIPVTLINPDELVLRRLARFVGSFSTECRSPANAIGIG